MIRKLLFLNKIEVLKECVRNVVLELKIKHTIVDHVMYVFKAMIIIALGLQNVLVREIWLDFMYF